MSSTLQGIPVDPTPPSTNDVLQFDGAQYTPTALAGGGGLTLLGKARKEANSLLTGAPIDIPDLSVAVVSGGGNLVVFLDCVALLGTNAGGYSRTAGVSIDIDGTVYAGHVVGQVSADDFYRAVIAVHVPDLVFAAGAHTVKAILSTQGGQNVQIDGSGTNPAILSVWEQA